MHNSFFTKFFSALMIVTLALGAIPTSPAYAAAAQLNPWTLAASTGGSGNNGTIAAGNLTVSAGANRLFVAAVCMELSGANDFTTLNISLGGVPLTEIDSTENGNFQEHCYMGYLLNSQIPAGSNALTVPYNIDGNTSTVQGAHVYWASYSGINQANPINDSNANSNNAASVNFGTQIDYLLDGVTFYVAGNLGTSASMTAPATFTQQLATTTNGHSSFIGRITTIPHAAAGNYGGGTNVTFGGTTGARSSLVVASLRPLIAETTTGIATATAASSSSINVSMPYTFDEDADNTYTIQYCLTSSNCSVSGLWINFVTGAAHTASPYTNTITGLAASTSYDVRVTYIDADGVNGTNPQIIANVLTLPPPSEIDVQGNGISINDGDGTPSATDFTDFGNVPENFSVDRTFTILNTGAGNLTLGAIAFIGGNNGDFSVVTPPTSPVLPGGTTTFTVRLTAGGGGGATRDTTLVIVNNDPNEAPYNFDIQGTRFNAEINVQSLGNNINSTILQLPSLANCTRFPDTGLTGYSDCTYTIQNLSPATVLHIDTVTFTGGATGDYSVVTPPAATVPVGGSTTFTVRFTPTVVGLRATILSFINNDSNESPYIFPIAGLATANTPPTTSGITDVNVLEDDANTVFSLYPSFADVQNTDAQLIYTVTGNTNPGLFTSVSIADPTNFTLAYTPNENGVANITIRATDTGGLFVEDIFQVTVTAVNDEPDFTAANPAAVNEDAGAQSIPGWVTAVDFGPTDEDGSQTVSQYIISNSTCGTLLSADPAVNNAGDLTYTPNTDQNGTCTFDVQVQDDGGILNGGDDTSPIHNFTITVSVVNDEPDFTAANPAAVIEDSGLQSIAGWVTAVDFGPADEDVNQSVSQYIISNSTCGTLLSTGPTVSVAGTLTYTPAADQNGTCIFDVQVQDDGGILNGGDDTSPAHNFTITVTDVNDEPDFTATDPATVNEDAGAQTVAGWVTAVDFGPADEDLNQAVAQYIISNSTCGTLLSAGPAVSITGTLTYTPAADQNGTCTFDVQVQDDGGVLNGGDDTSPIHNFTITVAAVNDEPDFTATDPAAVSEDAGAQTVPGWVTAVDFGPADEDLSQAVLQYIISNSTCGTLLSAGPAVNVTGDLTFTPAVDQNGTCTFDVQVQDNGGVALGGDDTSPAHTFTITVSAVNEEPDFTATDPAAVNEDAGLQSVVGWVTAVDFGPPDEDISQSVLGYIISNNTCGTLLSSGPAVSVTGTLTYTPAVDQNGTCTFDTQVQDDGGVALGGDDTGPIHNFTITVIAVNDEPIFSANNPSPVNEDAGAQSILGWAATDLGPADEDLSQAIAQYIVSGSTCGTLLSAGPAVSVAGTLTYTPAANANGTCTFDVAVQDNGGIANGGDDTSLTQNFTITVNTVNDEPNFTASNPAAVNEDAGAQSVAGWVTSINLGPANEAAQSVLGYIISNNASCAALLSAGPSVDAAGILTYTPAADANGTCTFDVQVQDNGGTANGSDDTSPAQNFTITVNAVNDEPSFTASNPPTVYEDSVAQSIPGWATPSFGPANEAGQAVAQYIVSNSTCATLLSAGPAVSNAGALTYTPAADQNGTCTFDVQVQDNGGTANGGDDTSPTQNFTIIVTAQTIVTANITANDKVYDGNNTATFTCSLTGVVPPDVVNCTGGTATFNDKNVDVNKLVTATGLGLSGVDAFKYQLSVTTATDTADITQRTLVVTATGIDKIYDGNTTATVTLADNRVGGDVFDVNYTTATFVDPNVNVNITINVSGISIGAGADAGNYTLNGVTTASTDADITIAGQTITVTTSAPTSAVNGSSFNVAATASSGLPVTISVSGVCTVADLDGSVTDGDATVTMISGIGNCSVFYDQAGDTNFTPAPQVQEDVTATDSPVITSADNASFDLGFVGTFNITATGNPSIMVISVTGTLPNGIIFTDNGDGTANFSGTPAAGTTGVYPLVLTANNGVNPNGTQNFTLTVRNGPIASNVNSLPDTGDGSITENESVPTTLSITELTVEFSQDVYDVPASTTDPDEVDNPVNYILVRSATGVFNTLSCAAGVVAPDIINPVTAVTYSDGGGSGPFVATLTLTTPLTTVGHYRLFVCGTTSIVDAVNTGLILAGDGTTPGTDFNRNFVLAVPAAGGGGGGRRDDDNKLAVAALPATGFAPGRITALPVQPDELAYSDLGDLWIEIPSLGIKTSIIGVPQTENGEWDVTWLANNVGWLNGTAFPTWEGNSVVTAHVTNADGVDGPFANLKKLKYGDQIIIHLYGQKYIFEIRNSRMSKPFTTSFAFEHLEEQSYLTLITCQVYLPESDSYLYRRVIRAVLVSVQDE